MGFLSLISQNFGVPVLLEATTTTSGDVLTELGTYLTQLISWAGTVLTTVWDNQILRVLAFMAIPLIGIGVLARIMRSI